VAEAAARAWRGDDESGSTNSGGDGVWGNATHVAPLSSLASGLWECLWDAGPARGDGGEVGGGSGAGIDGSAAADAQPQPVGGTLDARARGAYFADDANDDGEIDAAEAAAGAAAAARRLADAHGARHMLGPFPITGADRRMCTVVVRTGVAAGVLGAAAVLALCVAGWSRAAGGGGGGGGGGGAGAAAPAQPALEAAQPVAAAAAAAAGVVDNNAPRGGDVAAQEGGGGGAANVPQPAAPAPAPAPQPAAPPVAPAQDDDEQEDTEEEGEDAHGSGVDDADAPDDNPRLRRRRGAAAVDE
jgi:hypothetical protein